MTPVVTYDAEITACGRIATPLGRLLLYGTVLPYHADRMTTGTARTWTEFLRVLPEQRDDWARLRAAYPDDRFCVAGDLNQSLDGRRWSGREWYGTQRTRSALREAVATAALRCVSHRDFVAAGELITRSSIDHICLDAASTTLVRCVWAWEAGRVTACG